MEMVWEDLISLNSQAIGGEEVLGAPAAYRELGLAGVDWNQDRFPISAALANDTAPIPTTAQREGYYGENHFAYWASGLRDYDQVLDWAESKQKQIKSVLDLGCATGRFLRHVYFQSRLEKILGCDINRLHVDWICRYLPKEIRVFQNTSLPILPLDSGSVDLVTAFSVYTHIESFDTTWMMEIRRVLKPGGIAWLTIHGDRTWRDLDPTWPIYDAIMKHPAMPDRSVFPNIPSDRFVLRWKPGSYSGNVYYKYEYIRNVWGRFMDVADIIPARPHYQDIVILTK